MLTLRMHEQLSGGRHDGRPWPPPDRPFDVPDWEFRDLIRAGLADPDGPAARAVARDLAEQPTPGHPSKLDPRPVTQAEAEVPETPLDDLKAAAVEYAGSETAAGQDSAEPAGAEPAAAEPVTGEPDAAAAGEPPAVPGPSSPKQAWIEFAMLQGADVHEASNMTKADLMSRYGGRL